jgi:hypothetical protein
MNWCNCNHDDYYNLTTSVNDYGVDGHKTCYTCGNIINDAELISLLVKEVKSLNQTVEDLERDRNLHPVSDLNFTYEQIQEKIREFRSIEEDLRVHAINVKQLKELEKEVIELRTTTHILTAKTKALELDRDKLTIIVDWLKSKENKREEVEIKEADRKMVEEDYLLENADKQTERFEMMDL